MDNKEDKELQTAQTEVENIIDLEDERLSKISFRVAAVMLFYLCIKQVITILRSDNLPINFDGFWIFVSVFANFSAAISLFKLSKKYKWYIFFLAALGIWTNYIFSKNILTNPVLFTLNLIQGIAFWFGIIILITNKMRVWKLVLGFAALAVFLLFILGGTSLTGRMLQLFSHTDTAPSTMNLSLNDLGTGYELVRDDDASPLDNNGKPSKVNVRIFLLINQNIIYSSVVSQELIFNVKSEDLEQDLKSSIPDMQLCEEEMPVLNSQKVNIGNAGRLVVFKCRNAFIRAILFTKKNVLVQVLAITGTDGNDEVKALEKWARIIERRI